MVPLVLHLHARRYHINISVTIQNVFNSLLKNEIQVVRSNNDEGSMLNVRVHSMGYLKKLRSIFDQCTKFYLSMHVQIKFEISKGLRIGNNYKPLQFG